MMPILIAEDDLTSRKILAAMLTKWGYQVIVTCDGREAWEALSASGAPSFAILDWMMPEMDGVEICRKLRESVHAGPVYVILLTAKGSKDDIVSGLDAGADDYITKPFHQAELRARVGVGQRIVELQTSLSERVGELQKALAKVKTLEGLLPICMYCHKIRDTADVWQKLEVYMSQHTDVQLSHGLCPECLEKYYPENPKQ